MTAARELAWGAVHEALPARWLVGPPTYDPGVPGWSVTARGPHPGRAKAPQTVSGTGDDEVAALRNLDDLLRGVPRPEGGRMDELRARLRLAYVEVAESWAMQKAGRRLTLDELERVIERYTGP